MLKTRVMPTLLWDPNGLYKGVAFDSWRGVGAVLPAVKVYDGRDVDELVLLDIRATEEGRKPELDLIKEYTSACFVPLSVGGGIACIEDVTEVLRAGADKVVLNSVLYDDIELLKKSASRFGRQCLVVSIDVTKEGDEYNCYSNSGKKPTNRKVVEWAKEVAKAGAGEILLTSIEKDGTMSGYDIDLIKTVSECVEIPVIASGGAGKKEDFLDALLKGGANAVAAASVFHFTQLTPKEVKLFLAENYIPVRIPSF